MKKTDILVPHLPESITDATIVKWHKKIGEIVNYNENLVDIETDKVMLEVSAPCKGVLNNILETEGSIVTAQQILGRINNIDNCDEKNIIHSSKKDTSILSNNKKHIEKNYSDDMQSFSPSIRRLRHLSTNDHDIISTNNFNNTPSHAHIIHGVEIDSDEIVSNTYQNSLDLQQNINNHNIPFTHRVKMTRLRQKIAERLLETKKNTAMLTTFNEVNMQPVIRLRQKYGELFEKKHGVKIGFMSFYVKAVIEALKKFPEINAYIDKKDIVYYKNFDINIAISTPRGLITPVLRNADTMSMSEIEKKIKEFSVKGYQNKITIQELSGGNFTITNGGIFGSLMSTPIINPPQTAILGMHLIKDRPMAIHGKVVILPMMYLALSYDHRLIDGKESVNFLLTIKNIIEDFTRILIDI